MCRTCWRIRATGMRNNRNRIKAVCATLTGPLHTARGMPCQDCCKYGRAGKNFIAVVSDGAGSAKYGKIGAKIICETLNDLLKNAPLDNIRETVIHAIAVARGKLQRHRLNKNKASENIDDFAATLVGMACRGNNGVFFHIGDGAAIAFSGGYGEDFTASRPENGRFSCETYFYTMDDWKDNLRFTPFENAQTVFLMSDGVTNFAFSRDFNRIERGFLYPINDYLESETSKSRAARALVNTLNTPQARKLNNDDKTLFWAKLS